MVNQTRVWWTEFYLKTMGVQADFSDVELSPMTGDIDARVFMAAGLTPSLLVEVYANLAGCFFWGRYVDPVRIVTKPRKPGHYAFSFRYGKKGLPDQKWRPCSGDDLQSEQANGYVFMNFEERVMLGILEAYLKRHGMLKEMDRRLDRKGVTLFPDSRLDGNGKFVSINLHHEDTPVINFRQPAEGIHDMGGREILLAP